MTRGRPREIGTLVVTLSVVLGATAGALRLLDALPARLRQDPPGVTRVASVADAERVVGARLWLPAGISDTLRPAARSVTVHAGPPATVTLAFADDAGEVALLVVQSLGVVAATPPAGEVLHARAVTVDGASATLSRYVGGDGRVWHDLAWSREGRTLLLRARAPAEELVRMAGTMRP